VAKFRYLEIVVRNQNSIHEEMKNISNQLNPCYLSVLVFSPSHLSSKYILVMVEIHRAGNIDPHIKGRK
jgi:hypothetical protein